MRSLLSVLLATIILAPLPTDLPAIGQSVCPLQSPIEDEEGEAHIRNICTVTSINAEKHYWLTAAHCVMPEMLIANHAATVVFIDKDADLLVLQTVNYARPALTLRQTAPDVDEPVLMAGHPVGLMDIQVFSGHVSSLLTRVGGETHMMFNLIACNGNSGSAVVDAEGRVVSVLQIAFGPGCGSFSGGAPYEVVRRLVGAYFG